MINKSFLVKIFGHPATLFHGDLTVIDRWLWIKDRLPITKDQETLLDIGCGSGFVGERFLEMGIKISEFICVDTSENILEKAKEINAIKLDIPWSDLDTWKEISKIYKKHKSKYFKKKNVYYRPWGRYVNLFEGKNFLVKELTVNSKSSISLQKHHHRSEHWTISQGKPIITVNKNKFFKKENETVFIPTGVIHRIENRFKKPVKIIEVQIGAILRESDIIRYQDVYGRIK